MNNYILGSGLVGLLARHILGPSYKIIPFYRSRFYTFNPALDDNFLVRDKRTDKFIEEINGGKLGPVYMYKKMWSVGGALSSGYDKELCYRWLAKIFGYNVPNQSMIYQQNQMDVFVYDLRLNKLYQTLMEMYSEEIKAALAHGTVTAIKDHRIAFNTSITLPYDKIISTIPLNALCKYINKSVDLKARTLHYLHITTEELDFEGANQVLVTDGSFDFYKVTNVAPNRYMIYCHNEMPDPGLYLMQFMRNFDIIDGTSVTEALPIGQPPDVTDIESLGIQCVGGNAQWDWCMDISSCIIKLLRIANNTQHMQVLV